MKTMLGKWIVILGVLLFLPSVSLYAQSIFSSDFSKAQGYVDGPIVGQPAGQSVQWLNGDGATGSTAFAIANEALVITQDNTTKWILLPLPVQTGNFIITFDWQYVGAADSTIDVGFCVSDTGNFNLDGNAAPTFNEEGLMCRMSQTEPLVIDARNGDRLGGGSYASLTAFKYQDGKNISMRFEVNAAKEIQTFNVYAKKDGEQEVQLGKNYGFRRGIKTGLNTIAIWEDGVVAGTKVIIDNLVLAAVPATAKDWDVLK